MKELLFAFMLIASRLSGLPIVDDVPPVAFMTAEALCAEVYGRQETCDSDWALNGYYDRATGRMALADDWSAADAESLGALVHELVHHLQARHYAVRPCNGVLEAQAYAAQAAFLESIGEEFSIDPMALVIMTVCE